MTTKETIPYYQLPKILMKHSGMTPSHVTVFAYLYDQLRQESYCKTGYNKTNENIAENALVGSRQTKRLLNDLEEWGFLKRTGMTINRKFYLGDKFTARDKSAPSGELTRDKSAPNKGHIGTLTRDKSALHNKNLFNNLNKDTAINNSQTSKPKTHDVKRSEYVNEVKHMKHLLGDKYVVPSYDEWALTKDEKKPL